MQHIVNLSGYKFIDLTDLSTRQRYWRELCQSLDLKGSVHLAPEGINLMLAGTRSAVDKLLTTLEQQPEYQNIFFKESLSNAMPFRRLFIKLKTELVPLGAPHIRPHERTAPNLPPSTLKAWLDDGKEFLLLDLRNDFEYRAGTFNNAKQLPLQRFNEFATAIKKLDPKAQTRPIVTFCTGGIRCEKASAYMLEQGFENVYQLEGGILNYFEQCGGAHYQGECFVFDERVALNPDLTVSESDSA